ILDQWEELLNEMKQHLGAHQINLSDDSIKLSPMLELNAATERFEGQHAEMANQYLKREYRSKFAVPEIS
ncbi:gfo/Idh/MocA family oxidoreductase, partial [Rubripirellula sp.]|nr:gfo/Idh/MocA family oxidoreductase [Rubripirellula sp.]